jgi:hypothetical protein
MSVPRALFADNSCMRSLRWVIVVVALLTATAEPAEARSRSRTGVPMGGYDGYWNVLIITQVGACDRTYRFPVTISRGRVLGGGGPRVSGRVGRGGAVAVSVSAGNSYASGSGRLGTTSGGGRWSGRGSLGVCAGRWQATRSSF